MVMVVTVVVSLLAGLAFRRKFIGSLLDRFKILSIFHRLQRVDLRINCRLIFCLNLFRVLFEHFFRRVDHGFSHVLHFDPFTLLFVFFGVQFRF